MGALTTDEVSLGYAQPGNDARLSKVQSIYYRAGGIGQGAYGSNVTAPNGKMTGVIVFDKGIATVGSDGKYYEPYKISTYYNGLDSRIRAWGMKIRHNPCDNAILEPASN